jgi:hypothetical protein
MDNFKNHPLYRCHNIDTAISSLWEFYKKRFLPLFLMSLAMSFVMQLLSTTIDYSQLQNTTDIQVMIDAIKVMIWPMVGIMVSSLLFNIIMSYFILFNPLNPETKVFTSILQSLKYFIPYLAVIVFLLGAGSLIIGIGLMVFIVGVIFSVILLMTVYMFIAPVLLIEGSDIMQTIRRTIKLSYNNFWTNIGWVSILIILVLIISIGLSAIILLPFSGGFVKTITNPGDTTKILELVQNPVYIVLSTVAGALTLPLMPIFSFILYFNSVASLEKEQSSQNKDDNDGRVRVEDLYAKPYYDENASLQNKDEINGNIRVEDLYAKPNYDEGQQE